MSLYMYEFGVIVEADTEEDAWELVRMASQALDKVDFEGESSVEGPLLCDKQGFPIGWTPPPRYQPKWKEG